MGQDNVLRYKKLQVERETTLALRREEVHVYVCRCNCGETCMVEVSAFEAGKRNSCGCTRPKTKAKHTQLPGDRMGMLELLSPIFLDVGSVPQRQWLCRCNCGQYTVAEQTALMKGLRKTCGCHGFRNELPTVAIVPGDRFGDLETIGEVCENGKNVGRGVFRRYWECRCLCGQIERYTKCALIGGHVKRCSECRSRNLRGKIRTEAMRIYSKEYRTWVSMIYRCHKSKPGSNDYRRYRERGIVVCKEWRDSFDAFLASVGQSPSDTHSIDRINNNGSYEPSNVRWATPREQGLNTRTVPMLQARIYDLQAEIAALRECLEETSTVVE